MAAFKAVITMDVVPREDSILPSSRRAADSRRFGRVLFTKYCIKLEECSKPADTRVIGEEKSREQLTRKNLEEGFSAPSRGS